MPGESQETPASPPDPSVFTTEQLVRVTDAQRDWVVSQFQVVAARLDAMDKATELLSETVTRTPTEITKQIKHLRELTEEKFESTQRQFQERDTRQERESRDNKLAVDAAFAAQEKQAAAQNKANAEAREKSEASTADLLGAQGDKIDDVKERVGRLENLKAGGQQAYAGIYALGGFVLVVLLIIAAVIAFGDSPPP